MPSLQQEVSLRVLSLDSLSDNSHSVIQVEDSHNRPTSSGIIQMEDWELVQVRRQQHSMPHEISMPQDLSVHDQHSLMEQSQHNDDQDLQLCHMELQQ